MKLNANARLVIYYATAGLMALAVILKVATAEQLIDLLGSIKELAVVAVALLAAKNVSPD